MRQNTVGKEMLAVVQVLKSLAPSNTLRNGTEQHSKVGQKGKKKARKKKKKRKDPASGSPPLPASRLGSAFSSELPRGSEPAIARQRKRLLHRQSGARLVLLKHALRLHRHVRRQGICRTGGWPQRLAGEVQRRRRPWPRPARHAPRSCASRRRPASRLPPSGLACAVASQDRWPTPHSRRRGWNLRRML